MKKWTSRLLAVLLSLGFLSGVLPSLAEGPGTGAEDLSGEGTEDWITRRNCSGASGRMRMS